MEAQLDIFEDIESENYLKLEIKNIHSKMDNLRKGLFSRHGDVCKIIISMRDEIEDLKMQIEKINNFICKTCK